MMDYPERYVKYNGPQRRDAADFLNRFLKRMTWEPNEIILDIGCGPGDVTTGILFSRIKNKIVQLVAVDKSRNMIEYAENNYGAFSNKINFKVLDIENTNECEPYSCHFNKLFSFYCLHWTLKKLDTLVNMHRMLKNGGQVLACFLLVNPLFVLYKVMDAEWQQYVGKLTQNMTVNLHSKAEVKAIFIEAGFQIIHIEARKDTYKFIDFEGILNSLKAVDGMYNILPQHLHEKYSIHLEEKIREKKIVDICPDTITMSYKPVIVHAIKIEY